LYCSPNLVGAVESKRIKYVSQASRKGNETCIQNFGQNNTDLGTDAKINIGETG